MKMILPPIGSRSERDQNSRACSCSVSCLTRWRRAVVALVAEVVGCSVGADPSSSGSLSSGRLVAEGDGHLLARLEALRGGHEVGVELLGGKLDPGATLDLDAPEPVPAGLVDHTAPPGDAEPAGILAPVVGLAAGALDQGEVLAELVIDRSFGGAMGELLGILGRQPEVFLQAVENLSLGEIAQKLAPCPVESAALCRD